MLALCAAAIVACQDGYPIAATQCDLWCEQSRRVDCEMLDPAACVVACEQAGLGRPACASLVAETVQCLRGKTDAELACELWSFTGQAPCRDAQAAAQECGSAGGPGNPAGTH